MPAVRPTRARPSAAFVPASVLPRANATPPKFARPPKATLPAQVPRGWKRLRVSLSKPKCPLRKTPGVRGHQFAASLINLLPPSVAEPRNITKKLKYHCLDYVEVHGSLTPDPELAAYITRKTLQEFNVDQLRYRAASSCPYTEGGAIDAYFDAAETFDRDFVHPVLFADELDELLATKRQLRQINQRLGRLDPETQAQLAGRPVLEFVIQNPFPVPDPRHKHFYTQIRERWAALKGVNPDTLPWSSRCASLQFTLKNHYHQDPFDARCREQYCKYEFWQAQLQELEANGQIEARSKALPNKVSTYSFYGTHDSGLY
ncbi:hypothetical protein K438DRAFT_1790359 [Mycena galopus ATCC 62051]|nr:hypothetical protein K438DRAFT_1790359 [Mycena galopus ATCC 62051]